MSHNEEKNRVKTSGKAIASLVLAILGIFLVAIPSIIGIILGHIARSEIKKSNGQLEGKGLALSGLIIGYLTVAIVLLGIIAAIMIPSLMGNLYKARNDLTCINMATTARSLDMFKLDNGVYPSTEEGLDLLVNPNLDKYPNYASSAYLSKIPTDSWGNSLSYIKTADGFDIISSGLDSLSTDDDIKYSTCKK